MKAKEMHREYFFRQLDLTDRRYSTPEDGIEAVEAGACTGSEDLICFVFLRLQRNAISVVRCDWYVTEPATVVRCDWSLPCNVEIEVSMRYVTCHCRAMSKPDFTVFRKMWHACIQTKITYDEIQSSGAPERRTTLSPKTQDMQMRSLMLVQSDTKADMGVKREEYKEG